MKLNSSEPNHALDWQDAVALGRLTAIEAEARRRELAGRPTELRRFEQEMALNTILDSRPAAMPVASNFAAQVWSQIEKDDRAAISPASSTGSGRSKKWWSVFSRARPAWGLALGLVFVSLVTWQARSHQRREQMASTVAAVALTTSAPGLSAQILEDYEVIRRLGAQAQPGDEALIAALAENPAP